VQGGISVLNGITQVSGGPVRYALGCDIDGDSREGFAEAVAAARASTVAVLCMGNSEKTEGENKDRHNLDLPGVQQALIHEIVATGVPVVVVLINGSAVTMMQWHDAASAIVEAWYPGQEGGAALAQVLYGSVNPSGKLPISFPKYASQLPVTYNQYPTGRLPDYVDLRGEQAWYPFGWGLSYTIFSYRDLVATYAKGTVVVSVIVANEGSRAGDEVVQLYVRDREASLARPRCELKGFKKLWLKPGEKKRVRFTLTKADLSFLDARCNMRFEPGVFTCMVGGNSRDTIAQDILVS
jgi:beta-glucosidase